MGDLRQDANQQHSPVRCVNLRPCSHKAPHDGNHSPFNNLRAGAVTMTSARELRAALKALESPAAERNKTAIADALAAWLPTTGSVLELACGALQHARLLAAAHPALRWHPTDCRPELLSIASKLPAAFADEWPANLDAPTRLDVLEGPWPAEQQTVVYAANLLHIAPWSVTEALFKEAPQILANAGILVLYGPFREDGAFRSDGDERFDATLKAQNPLWGIRDREALDDLALAAGLTLRGRLEMPANNLLLRYVRP